mmetsp:Transcript_135805/g.330124  ORF Transcript_135805/g.330124 Transcript_135805/m.330124 type:complete len:204 (+) Transcript_135805:1902-2513(+)
MDAASASVPQSHALASEQAGNSAANAVSSSGITSHADRRFSMVIPMAPALCWTAPSPSVQEAENDWNPAVETRTWARNAEIRTGHVMSALTSAALMCGRRPAQSPQSPCVAVCRSHRLSCRPVVQSAEKAEAGAPVQAEHCASADALQEPSSYWSGSQSVHTAHTLAEAGVQLSTSYSPGPHGRQSRSLVMPYVASKKRRMRM